MTILIIVRAADKTRPHTSGRIHEIRSVPFTPASTERWWEDDSFTDAVARHLGCGRYGVSDILGWDVEDFVV